MRVFPCGRCGLLQEFESQSCVRCGSAQGFEWEPRTLVPDPSARCVNVERAECNWVPARAGELCFCCARTRTRPSDDDAFALLTFAKAEGAKRRLFYELGELGLPIPEKLRFDLLSSRFEPVTTGHADGLVTLDLAEAIDAHRTEVREQMAEPYRTLLGHMRHEVGHFYFEVLAVDPDRVRALFGDEREDYQAALERHYESGPPDDWSNAFVSAYATMHPSEDWAETFAHVLHIRETLQTAAAHQVRVGTSTPRVDLDLRSLMDDWHALTYALNAINRSMGQEDLYPFVLSPPVIDKLALVDTLIAEAAAA